MTREFGPGVEEKTPEEIEIEMDGYYEGCGTFSPASGAGGEEEHVVEISEQQK